MATNTKVKFEGETRGFCDGGNSATAECGIEKHDTPKGKGKTFGQDAKIGRCLKMAPRIPRWTESEVTGTKRREPSAPAKIRSKNNLRRDQNTNLGRGKSSSIVTD